MRAFIFIVILAGAFDWIAFKGQYSSAIWDDAKYEGQLLNVEVQRLLNKLDR